MFKPILAVVAGVLLASAVFAADVELKPDHPDTYVVQKGDTLWDIAGRFLNEPWLWPEIWQANPQVENPHLIYPGDKLSLVYLGGRPHLVMDRGEFGPRVRREPLGDAVTAISLGDVRPFLERMRIFDKSEIDKMPYVVALEEDRLRATTGQFAYVRRLSAAAGTRVTIVRPTYVYYDVPVRFPWEDAPREVRAEEWQTDHSVTAYKWWTSVAVNHAYRRQVEYLGHEVQEVGHGEVLRVGEVSTVLIDVGDTEIKEGDLIVIGESMPFDLSFQPHPPAQVPENMRVVAFTDALTHVGRNQVVALSKGARDGVENGQVYSVFSPGTVVRDEITYPSDDLRTLVRPSKANVTLPEEFNGHVMVFRTFDKISYGLVMDGIRPVSMYDVLHQPVR